MGHRAYYPAYEFWKDDIEGNFEMFINPQLEDQLSRKVTIDDLMTYINENVQPVGNTTSVLGSGIITSEETDSGEYTVSLNTSGAINGQVLTFNGGSISWANAITADTNFANTDLTLNANRTHNTGTHDLVIDGLSGIIRLAKDVTEFILHYADITLNTPAVYISNLLNMVTEPAPNTNGDRILVRNAITGDIESIAQSTFTNYTDEDAQDAVFEVLDNTGSNTLSYVYDDATNDFFIEVIENTTIQKVQVSKNSTLVGARKRLNFIEGSNVLLTILDDSINDTIDIEISASGGGGGGGITIEDAQDAVGGILLDSSTIDFIYNDASPFITASVITDSSVQKVETAKAGTLISTRKRLNFIDGGNISITVSDDLPNNRTNLTIANTFVETQGFQDVLSISSSLNQDNTVDVNNFNFSFINGVRFDVDTSLRAQFTSTSGNETSLMTNNTSYILLDYFNTTTGGETYVKTGNQSTTAYEVDLFASDGTKNTQFKLTENKVYLVTNNVFAGSASANQFLRLINATTGEVEFQTVTIPTQYTDEMAQDAVASMLVAGSNITLTYNDVANTLTIASTGGSTTNVFQTTVTSTATQTLTTSFKTYVYNGTSDATWTMPAVSGNTDVYFVIKNKSAKTITMTAAGSDVFYSNASVTTYKVFPGESITLVNDSVCWIII